MTEIDTSADPELQLKKRARRRLVGAVALVLLAVIILPMVMDHDPRPPTQDIQVHIPSQETEGLAAKILPNRAAATLPPATEHEAALPASGHPEPQTAIAPAQPENKTAGQSAAVALKADVATSGDADAQQWVVQLGAYKETSNVKQLLAKIKELQLPAYTENFLSEQGMRTRVRAGPFASREEADKAEAKIKKIGVNGKVAVK